MATQKQCVEYVKAWAQAADVQEATKQAVLAAKEFDGLYDESAKNLLARTPDLMLLLTAFMAGREAGIAEEAERHKPVQDELQVAN